MSVILALTLYLLCIPYSQEFLFGVATAAYQVEGAASIDGRLPSIWDSFSKLPNKTTNGDTGDIAADAYHHLEEDVALMKSMSLNSYRFSLSWSRIIPEGRGAVNALGLRYYNRLIDLLMTANITPVVTLYHWDLPLSLENEYLGWLSSDIEIDFRAYADVCFSAFGDRVKMWTTINEPWTFSVLGYGTGDFAPGRCSDRMKCTAGNTATETYLVGHNVLNAHASVVELYRTQYQSRQQGQIGIVLNLDWAEPFNISSDVDRTAATRMNEFTFDWFADPLFFGSYPLSMQIMVGERLPRFTQEQIKRLQGSCDFIGLNHYSMKFVEAIEPDHEVSLAEAFNASVAWKKGGWFDDQKSMISSVDSNGNTGGLHAASPWLVVAPEAFQKVLSYVSERYNSVIYVTENGVDVPGESQMTVQEALRDVFRINYYKQYLEQLQIAMHRGIDIKGYFAWSLLDNFEWKDGYNYRFGLNYVDYGSAQRNRTPKESAKWYKNYIETHRIENTLSGRDRSQEGQREKLTSLFDYLNAALFQAGGRWPAEL